MLRITLKISDSFFKREIILNDNSYCAKDLKQFISNSLKVPQDEFSFVDSIQPNQPLSSLPPNPLIEIKFINPSDDLNFQFPNNEIITVEKAARSNYPSIVKSFEKNGLYFSDFYVKKALNFYVFGEKIPKDGYNFKGLPKCVNINVKIHDKTVIIVFDNKKFIFYENEYVKYAIDALQKAYSPLIFFNIKSTKLNLILTYKDAQLKLDDKYEITSGFKCTFIGPKNTKCDIPLNCLSTFYYAKQFLSQLFNLNSSPNLDIIIYSGDTLIEDLSMRVFYFLGKSNFFFDIVNKSNSTPPEPTQQHPTTEVSMIQPQGKTNVFDNPTPKPLNVSYPTLSSAPPLPPNPNPTDPSTSGRPASSPVQTSSPSKPETEAGDDSASKLSKTLPTKSKRPKPVKVKTTEVVVEIEVCFNFEGFDKKIKPITKNVNSTQKVCEIFEAVKKESGLDGELELNYKNKDDKIKIDPNQTIGNIQKVIHQSDGQNVIYVRNLQKKTKSKPKSSVDEDSDESPKSKSKPKPERKSSEEDDAKSKPKAERKSSEEDSEDDSKSKSKPKSNPETTSNVDDDKKQSTKSKKRTKKSFKPTVRATVSSSLSTSAEHKTKADESLYTFIYDGNDKEFSFKKKSKLQSHISEIKSEFNIPEKVDIKMEKSSNGEEPTPIKDQNQPMETFNNCLITIYTKENKKTKEEKGNKIEYQYQTNESDEYYTAELEPEATVETFKLYISDKFDVDDIFNIKLIFAGKDLLNDIVLKDLNVGNTPLYVYIRSQQEILLMTAKALIPIKKSDIEEEEEVVDD